MQHESSTLSFKRSDNATAGVDQTAKSNQIANAIETKTPGGRERRAAVRQPIQRPAKLTDAQGLRYWAGHTVDVSDSGLLLAVDGPTLAVGTPVRVAVAWGGQGFLRESDLIPARVVRSLRSPSGELMLAIELKVAIDAVRQAA